MTGAYFAIGHCWGCGDPLTFNPERVPSIKIGPDGKPDPDGIREPLCRGCANALNDDFERRGLGRPLNVTDQAYAPVEGFPP